MKHGSFPRLDCNIESVFGHLSSRTILFIIMTTERVRDYVQKQVQLLNWERYAQRQVHLKEAQSGEVHVGILSIGPSTYGGKWLKCQRTSGTASLKRGAHVDLLRVDSSEVMPVLRGVVVQKQNEYVTLHVGRLGSLQAGNNVQLKACYLDATTQFVRVLGTLVEYDTLLRNVLLGLHPGSGDLGTFEEGLVFFNRSLNRSQKHAVS